MVEEVLKDTPFKGASVGIGSEVLGAFVGDEKGRSSFIDDKVKRMAAAVGKLAEVGSRSPQALHAAYTRALQHRTTYVERTTKTKNEEFRPIATAVSDHLIPALTGREVLNDVAAEALSLPIRLGGLGLSTPVQTAEAKFTTAEEATTHLTRVIRGLERWSEKEHNQIFASTGTTAKLSKRKKLEERADSLLSPESRLPAPMKRCMKRAREHPEANQWLFVTPSAISRTTLTPLQFQDGLNSRYGRDPKGIPTVCECGKNARNDLAHALTCMSGGGVVGRHNIIRDELAYLAREALTRGAFSVEKEVPLTAPGDRSLHRGGIGGRHQLQRDRGDPGDGSNRQQREEGGLQVDLRIRGLEDSAVVTDVDVRCIYPDARSYSTTEINKLLENDEKEKCDLYQQAVQAEGNRFRPFVVSTDGVWGTAAKQILRQLGDKLAQKWKKPQGIVGAWVRARMSLAKVRACSACIRGSKTPGGARARLMDVEATGDDSDGAFLGLQFSNGPAGQGRRVQ